MENEKLYKSMQELKKDIESSQQEVKVTDIIFYGKIEILNPETRKREDRSIYSVEKVEMDEITIQMYADHEPIANVLLHQENQIVINPKYKDIITPEMLLAKMEELKEQGNKQISQQKLEEMQEAREERGMGAGVTRKKQPTKPEEEKDKDEQDEEKKAIGKNDIEIDMNQYVTQGQRIADLIPELKQKNVKRCMIRSSNNIDFEVYGIDANGNEVKINSLTQTEGTNPSQEMIETNLDGSEVRTTRVSTMLKINTGTNDKKGNQGLAIKVGSMGIPEVKYYRRDQNDNYLAIPIGLKTTNDKKTTRELREMMTKGYNTSISDEIERAQERLEDDEPTQLENIDENLDNNVIDAIEIEMIVEAAKRNDMDVIEFYEIYKQKRGDTIEERIQETEEEIQDEELERGCRG